MRGHAIGREVGFDVPGLERLQLSSANGPGVEHPARLADRVPFVEAVRAEASQAFGAGVLQRDAAAINITENTREK